jgi:hypothetical protein
MTEDWHHRAYAALEEVQTMIGAGLVTHPLPDLLDDLRQRIAQWLAEDPPCP